MQRGRQTWLVLCALVIGSVTALNAQRPLSSLSPAQWQEDIRALQRDLTSKHADVHHTVTEAALAKAFADLAQSVATLESRRILVEAARVVAMVTDGHTELQLLQSATQFKTVPMVLYRYQEGMFITAIDRSLSELAGARITRVGSRDIEQAVADVTPLTSGDTPVEALHAVPSYLTSPDILFALGIVDSPESLPLEVVTRSGERRTVVLKPSSNNAGLITFREAAGVAPPLSASQPALYYWFAPVPSAPALYFQMNASMNQDGQPALADVTRDFFRRVDTDKPDTIVLDVRNNNGGNIARNSAWIKAIADRPAYQGANRLFVIVGRRTFSAGMDIVMELRRIAQPVIVGEPPRGLPSKPGNRETFTLPHSRLVIDYSQRIDSAAFRGPKTPLAVDLPAPPSFAAASAGVDPAVDVILKALGGKRISP